MTTSIQPVPNPFALMMDPESVFAAMARSDRLARLTSRICRPLDKPVVTKEAAEAAALDKLLEDLIEPQDEE